MELRITKKEYPNLFRLICENVICECEGERWFTAFGTKMEVEVEKRDGDYDKPNFKFDHGKQNQIDHVVIEAGFKWLQDNLKDEALVEYFLLKQKGKQNDNH